MCTVSVYTKLFGITIASDLNTRFSVIMEAARIQLLSFSGRDGGAFLRDVFGSRALEHVARWSNRI